MSPQMCFMKLRLATLQLSERFEPRMRISAAPDNACKWICSTRPRFPHLTVVNIYSIIWRLNINPVFYYFNRVINMGKFVISRGAAQVQIGPNVSLYTRHV